MSNKGITESAIIEAIRTVFDPEIPVNLYDLGLIYTIDIGENGKVCITMTLTNPNCPVADSIPEDVRQAVLHIAGVRTVDIKLVFDPPWDKNMMSDAAMLELGLF